MKSGRGQETLPEVRERLGGPPQSPGWVGRPSKKSRRSQEALPEVREAR